jgi:hypothetical protein
MLLFHQASIWPEAHGGQDRGLLASPRWVSLEHGAWRPCWRLAGRQMDMRSGSIPPTNYGHQATTPRPRRDGWKARVHQWGGKSSALWWRSWRKTMTRRLEAPRKGPKAAWKAQGHKTTDWEGHRRWAAQEEVLTPCGRVVDLDMWHLGKKESTRVRIL